MDTEKSINLLNSFIIINNARIKRYKNASKEAKQAYLKKVFENFQITSQRCKSELKQEIIKLGGTPAKDRSNQGYFHSIWYYFLHKLIEKDLHDVIYSCVRNETIVIQSYYEGIYNNLECLSIQQQTMLNEQYLRLNVERDKMQSYRSAF
ncbi:PA2169 family four-helix-bundle protein [Flavobacterium sp. XN-5]|uniref:PA2169 family four-helix-bundle protein n=1 Tax=Flavobacterium sp. XN-5 TaxID=2599390 RepID=UPI0011CC1F8C|nr:PA2169 family four-helix-bundle protein [Flavobacterium sp. XN-5]NGY38822.1 PA2169 family four-helix-bundle protein [Flavobacterium sp. XN-5]